MYFSRLTIFGSLRQPVPDFTELSFNGPINNALRRYGNKVAASQGLIHPETDLGAIPGSIRQQFCSSGKVISAYLQGHIVRFLSLIKHRPGYIGDLFRFQLDLGMDYFPGYSQRQLDDGGLKLADHAQPLLLDSLFERCLLLDQLLAVVLEGQSLIFATRLISGL